MRELGNNDPEKDAALKAELPLSLDLPPDGGLKAWLQVVGAFFLFFNSWVSTPRPPRDIRAVLPLATDTYFRELSTLLEFIRRTMRPDF